MGTAKKDISKIFNAETFIEGLLSGTLGILITLIINIPINLIIKHLLGVSNIASLPLGGAIALIIISILLNVFAGLIPAKIASKKDPAVVLRSE
jgi:putative ABC transport system permease protein